MTTATPSVETPKTAIELVTPELAEALLATNTSNRKVSQTNVEKMKRDMRNGDWQIGTDAIGVSSDGHLLNGQHRLTAVIESGIPVMMPVMRGLENRSVVVLDTGKSRTLADLLKMSGETRVHLLASVIRAVLMLESDGFYGSKMTATPSNSEGIEFLREHPELRNYVMLVDSFAHRAGCAPTPMACLLWLANKADAFDEGVRFIEKLASRVNEPEGSAIHAVCSRLDTARTHQSKLPTRNLIYLLINGFNKWSLGQPCAKLTVAPRNGEFRFPAIIAA
jgi:hypothetical protein